jgi:hypothetical protein
MKGAERAVLIVSKLVSKVPKPNARSWSVRYEVIGVFDINQEKPRRYIGHMW